MDLLCEDDACHVLTFIKTDHGLLWLTVHQAGHSGLKHNKRVLPSVMTRQACDPVDSNYPDPVESANFSGDNRQSDPGPPRADCT